MSKPKQACSDCIYAQCTGHCLSIEDVLKQLRLHHENSYGSGSAGGQEKT